MSDSAFDGQPFQATSVALSFLFLRLDPFQNFLLADEALFDRLGDGRIGFQESMVFLFIVAALKGHVIQEYLA